MYKKSLIIVALLFLLIDCLLVTYKLNKKNVHPIHKPKPHYKYSVFLTSDDGPLAGSKYLNQLVLDYEFPLTLFLVGKPLSQDKNLEPFFENYKENPYMLLGNHSFTHANLHYKRFYSNLENSVNDFLKNEQFLDLSSKIVRLPGRNVWVLDKFYQKGDSINALKTAQKLYNDYGYKAFGWDYELRYRHNGKILGSAKEHYKRIKELLKNNQTFTPNQIVILMHDQMFTNDKSSKILGELILLLQDDDEVKLKFLSEYKI